MIQFAAFLAKPFLGKLLPNEAKDKLSAAGKLLGGGSEQGWVPLGRQQATLPYAGSARATSSSTAGGIVNHDGKPIGWRQFDWNTGQTIDDCIVDRVSWRFYQNGLVCLELVASKDSAGLDVRDLVGHSIELRDNEDFLIGIWSAAFLIHRGTQGQAFQSATVDDYLPLKLHFEDIGKKQSGVSFRI